jgi:hypothetical protein
MENVNKPLAAYFESLRYLVCMKGLTLLALLIPFFAFSQSDLMMLNKNGAHEMTFATGMRINFETIYDQWFDGTITAIRHDSVFVNDVPFHYKEIKTIRRERTKLNYETDGTILMIAGGGVLLLGAVNGLYRGDPANEWYTTTSYIVAGTLLVGGYLLTRAHYKKYNLGKKYTLEYLELNPNKSQVPAL